MARRAPLLLTSVGLCLLSVGPAFAQKPVVIQAGPIEIEAADENTTRHIEEEWLLAQATRAGYEMVEAARMAARRADDPRVRAFARALAVAWNDEVPRTRGLCRGLGYKPPKKMTVDQRQALAALERHPDELFDRAFLALVAREHEVLAQRIDEPRAMRWHGPVVRRWADSIRALLVEQAAGARELERELSPPSG